MPRWCMSCGTAKMPEMSTTAKKTRGGKLKWKEFSRAALERKKVAAATVAE